MRDEKQEDRTDRTDGTDGTDNETAPGCLRGWIHDIGERPLGSPRAFEWNAASDELVDLGPDDCYGMEGSTWDNSPLTEFARFFPDGRRRLLSLMRCGLAIEVIGLAGPAGPDVPPTAYLSEQILEKQFPASAHARSGALATGPVSVIDEVTGPGDQSAERSEKSEVGTVKGDHLPLATGSALRASDLRVALLRVWARADSRMADMLETGALAERMYTQFRERGVRGVCVGDWHELVTDRKRVPEAEAWTNMPQVAVLAMWCALRDAVRECLGGSYADLLIPMRCERECAQTHAMAHPRAWLERCELRREMALSVAVADGEMTETEAAAVRDWAMTRYGKGQGK